MQKILKIMLLFISFGCFSQIKNDTVLTLEEFIAQVKTHHPIVKQAKLIVAESEAKLLKSRGSFDPKIEGNYSIKDFKAKTYFQKRNATFKIPTWYGLEFKAKYENNNGYYLNSELNTPNKGIYSAGVSLNLKGLWMSQRMATLKQAKLYTDISKAKQQLLINDILYKAIDTYFIWLKNYQEVTIYEEYKNNAKTRLENTIKSFKAGDKAEVDTLEANINFKNRLLDIQKSKIKLIKSSLVLSNYLWLENNTPVELTEQVIPDIKTLIKIDTVLNTSVLQTLTEHPKLKALEFKKKHLKINKQLKSNNLLPKINADYNFLTSKYDELSSLNTNNYKAGVHISIPLLLRKERAALKLATIKLQSIDFETNDTKNNLTNKIKATRAQIIAYKETLNIIYELVKNYRKLVNAEEKKFNFGEGSLFLVNYREVKLIEAELKQAKAIYDFLHQKLKLSNLYCTL